MDLQRTVSLAAEIASNYAQPVDASAVGRNLRRIRKAKGEKQEIVAERMGVQQARVSIWERGRYKSFDMQTLIKLAQGYGSTVDDILDGVDDAYDKHRDLIRQGDPGSSSAAQEGAQRRGPKGDAAAAARVQQQHLKAQKAFIRQVEDAAHRLLRLTTEETERLDDEGAETPARTAGGRGHHRKAG